MKHTLKTITCTGALLAGSLLTQASAFAQEGAENARRIVGLWDVTISITNCTTGLPFPVPPFPGEHKFEAGGTGQIVPGTNPAATSAHMMVWKYLGGGDYQWTAKYFRFDTDPTNSTPDGSRIGHTIIRSVVNISADGTTYLGLGEVTNYDLSGDEVGIKVCPKFEGSRFSVND
ncbi:hypothetical protein ACNKU7_08860 [Microbulbifer sp. SA54]|uniref:hypothetical protein n=1 Tax=Microbulbifer sp. SA54 TaxID=3401577 RepID=UPI003AAC3A78